MQNQRQFQNRPQSAIITNTSQSQDKYLIPQTQINSKFSTGQKPQSFSQQNQFQKNYQLNLQSNDRPSSYNPQTGGFSKLNQKSNRNLQGTYNNEVYDSLGMPSKPYTSKNNLNLQQSNNFFTTSTPSQKQYKRPKSGLKSSKASSNQDDIAQKIIKDREKLLSKKRKNMPIKKEKESLYEEIQALKLQLNEAQNKITKQQTQNLMLSKENRKMNKVFDNVDSYIQLQKGVKTAQPNDTSLIVNFKKQIKEQEIIIQQQEQQLEEAKKNSDLTRNNELQIENKLLQEENIKLKSLYNHALKDIEFRGRNSQLEISEEKYYLQNSIINTLQQENSKKSQNIQLLEDKITEYEVQKELDHKIVIKSKKEGSELKNEIQKLDVELSQYKHQNKVLFIELEKMKQNEQIEEAMRQNHEQKMAIEELQKILENKVSDIEYLTSINKDFKQRLDEKIFEFQKELQQKNSEIQNFKELYQQEIQKNEKLTNEIGLQKMKEERFKQSQNSLKNSHKIIQAISKIPTIYKLTKINFQFKESIKQQVLLILKEVHFQVQNLLKKEENLKQSNKFTIKNFLPQKQKKQNQQQISQIMLQELKKSTWMKYLILAYLQMKIYLKIKYQYLIYRISLQMNLLIQKMKKMLYCQVGIQSKVTMKISYIQIHMHNKIQLWQEVDLSLLQDKLKYIQKNKNKNQKINYVLQQESIDLVQKVNYLYIKWQKKHKLQQENYQKMQQNIQKCLQTINKQIIGFSNFTYNVKIVLINFLLKKYCTHLIQFQNLVEVNNIYNDNIYIYLINKQIIKNWFKVFILSTYFHYQLLIFLNQKIQYLQKLINFSNFQIFQVFQKSIEQFNSFIQKYQRNKNLQYNIPYHILIFILFAIFYFFLNQIGQKKIKIKLIIYFQKYYQEIILLQLKLFQLIELILSQIIFFQQIKQESIRIFEQQQEENKQMLKRQQQQKLIQKEQSINLSQMTQQQLIDYYKQKQLQEQQKMHQSLNIHKKQQIQQKPNQTSQSQYQQKQPQLQQNNKINTAYQNNQQFNQQQIQEWQNLSQNFQNNNNNTQEKPSPTRKKQLSQVNTTQSKGCYNQNPNQYLGTAKSLSHSKMEMESPLKKNGDERRQSDVTPSQSNHEFQRFFEIQNELSMEIDPFYLFQNVFCNSYNKISTTDNSVISKGTIKNYEQLQQQNIKKNLQSRPSSQRFSKDFGNFLSPNQNQNNQNYRNTWQGQDQNNNIRFKNQTQYVQNNDKSLFNSYRNSYQNDNNQSNQSNNQQNNIKLQGSDIILNNNKNDNLNSQSQNQDGEMKQIILENILDLDRIPQKQKQSIDLADIFVNDNNQDNESQSGQQQIDQQIQNQSDKNQQDNQQQLNIFNEKYNPRYSVQDQGIIDDLQSIDFKEMQKQMETQEYEQNNQDIQNNNPKQQKSKDLWNSELVNLSNLK